MSSSASEQAPTSSFAQRHKTTLGELNESGSLEVSDCTNAQFPKSTFAPIHT
jgi:hypothetical protein